MISDLESAGNSQPTLSEFETKLFIDPERPTQLYGWEVIEEAQGGAKRSAEKETERRKLGGSRATGTEDELRKRYLGEGLMGLVYEIGLLETYRDVIPPRWLNTTRDAKDLNIMYMGRSLYDLKLALRDNEQFSPDLVNALLNIPSRPHLQLLSELQKFDPKQLAWALYSPWLSSEDRQNVVDHIIEWQQQEYGVTDQEMEEAHATAAEFKRAEERGGIPKDTLDKALNPFQLELNSLLHISPDPDDVILAMSELMPKPPQPPPTTDAQRRAWEIEDYKKRFEDMDWEDWLEKSKARSKKS